MIFSLHYAHEFYGERRDGKIGGLDFPGGGHPDYWDFLYFSLVIGMTSQVSDVCVSSKYIRRVVAVHGVLSFFFNLTVLALTVNLVSNLIRMTAIFQTVLLMMAVLVAVAVAAKRLNVAPSILLVVAGVGLALVPGLPALRAGAGTGAAGDPAAVDLLRPVSR